LLFAAQNMANVRWYVNKEINTASCGAENAPSSPLWFFVSDTTTVKEIGPDCQQNSGTYFVLSMVYKSKILKRLDNIR
jgi:hypothetical protein